MTTVPLPAFELGTPSRTFSTAWVAGLTFACFRGGLIECTEGVVWLTHDGDCRDALPASAVRLSSGVAP